MTTNQLEPVEFESEVDIEDTLYEWKNKYPSHPLPGFSYWAKTSGPMPSQTTGIYNNEVLKLFKIFVFTDRVLWLLRRKDKKLLLLKRSPESGNLKGYVAWTGGIEGFGHNIIVYPESTGSAQYSSANAFGEPSHSTSKVTINDLTIAEEQLPRSSFGRSLRPTKRPLYISEFPRELEVPKIDLKRKAQKLLGRTKRVASEEPWDTIVVGHESWPHKTVKTEVDNIEHKRDKSLSSLSHSGLPLAYPTSSTNLESSLTESGRRTLIESKKALRNKKEMACAMDTLEDRRESADSRKKITFKEEEQSELKDPLMDVVLQFIVPGPEEGAMPVALKLCKEKQDFFNRAKQAWDMGSEPTLSEKQFRGVKCTLEGMKWPLIIVWDDVQVIDTLNSVLQNSKSIAGVCLNVEIRCMV
ncbi:hypothetical protein MMC14_008847 [Varicellaria rhodocarpa]|nr:hypothetical protein [Varicellaria rhodocarpa]